MTYEQFYRRILLCADEGNAANNNALLTVATLHACLRYFRAHEDHLARLVTLTTTPAGRIHARLAREGQEILDVYFKEPGMYLKEPSP